MKVAIINTNKKGEIIGTKFVKDQFGQTFEKYIVRILKHSGNRKTFTPDKITNYVIEVNPAAIHFIT
jgi:hypothetical protein